MGGRGKSWSNLRPSSNLRPEAPVVLWGPRLHQDTVARPRRATPKHCYRLSCAIKIHAFPARTPALPLPPISSDHKPIGMLISARVQNRQARRRTFEQTRQQTANPMVSTSAHTIPTGKQRTVPQRCSNSTLQPSSRSAGKTQSLRTESPRPAAH